MRKCSEPEIEKMGRKELEVLQLRRLKLRLRRCYRDSECYRENFKKMGMKPENIRRIKQ